jgi:large subunit ribosomal protein L54
MAHGESSERWSTTMGSSKKNRGFFFPSRHSTAMILRPLPRRIPRLRQPLNRCLHVSPLLRADNAPPTPSAKPVSKSSIHTPFPAVSKPPDNDPNFVHPPSAAKAGSVLKGVQILKDKPEVVALPDDYYPDWLWEIFEDEESVKQRAAGRQEIEEKKKIYIRQLKEEAIETEMAKVPKIGLLGLGEKRTEEERYLARRERLNASWLLNREKEELYEPPQFEMPPERSAKYHKKINKAKIKNDNYLRGRGML